VLVRYHTYCLKSQSLSSIRCLLRTTYSLLLLDYVLYSTLQYSIRHVLLDSRWIHVTRFEALLVHYRNLDIFPFQRSFTFRSFTRHLSVHGQRSPSTHGGWVTGFAGFRQFNHGRAGQALVIIIVEAHAPKHSTSKSVKRPYFVV
jgi:hypothetical protein